MKLTTISPKQAPTRDTAHNFKQGTILRCVYAPLGYTYAVGFVALKAFDFSAACGSELLQFDGSQFRVYGFGSQFYSQAEFVKVEPGTTVTLTQVNE